MWYLLLFFGIYFFLLYTASLLSSDWFPLLHSQTKDVKPVTSSIAQAGGEEGVGKGGGWMWKKSILDDW